MTDSETVSATTALPAPSRRRLLLTLAVALGVACVVLVTTVLPAEYGIDPTGVGRLLGLDRLDGPGGVPPPPPMAESAGGRVIDQPLRSETIEIPIGPREEVEHKIGIVADSTVLFEWTSDSSLYVDFHAHPYNDLDGAEIRYREADGVSSAKGAITAPYSGWHGWYWRNDSDQPVTVTLQVDGFFTHTRELHRGAAGAGEG